LVVALTFVAMLIGCAQEKEVIKPVPIDTGNMEPDWVKRGNGAFPGDRGKAIYGVGIASKDPNKALQRQMARQRGRQELASTLNTYVAGMMKDFMQTAKDYNDPSADSSIEFVQNVSKSVTDASLFFSQEINSWKDTSDDTLYVLMMVPLDEVLEQSKQKAQEVAKLAREKQADAFKGKTDEALKLLDAEIDKRRKAEGM